MDVFKRSIAIDEKIFGRDHVELAPTLMNLGNTLRDLVRKKRMERKERKGKERR